MQIWAESGKSALPIRNYSHILYQFLTFTQNLKRSRFLILSSSSGQTKIILDVVNISFYGGSDFVSVIPFFLSLIHI